MKTIYIDSEYRCHTTDPDGIFRRVDTALFDGKCDKYIEGCCYIPAGEKLVVGNHVYCGEMVFLWGNYDELDSAQRAYEQQQIAEYEAALSEIETALGVTE